MLPHKMSRVLLLVKVLFLALLGQSSQVEGSTEEFWRRGNRKLLASSLESWLMGPRSPPSSAVSDGRPSVAWQPKQTEYVKATGNTLTGMIAAGVGKTVPQTWTIPPPPINTGMVSAALSSVSAAGSNLVAPPPIITAHETVLPFAGQPSALASTTNCTEVSDMYSDCIRKNGKQSRSGKHAKCAELYNMHNQCKENDGKLPGGALPGIGGDAFNGGGIGIKFDGVEWPGTETELQGDKKDEKTQISNKEAVKPNLSANDISSCVEARQEYEGCLGKDNRKEGKALCKSLFDKFMACKNKGIPMRDFLVPEANLPISGQIKSLG